MSSPVSCVVSAETLALSAMGIHLLNKLINESREIQDVLTYQTQKPSTEWPCLNQLNNICDVFP